MSVPALVMNCLAPLMTQSPFSALARVRVLPASEPASGSVRPKAASRSPLAQARQPLLLLLLGAERDDRPGAQRRVRGDRDADARVHARELLDRERVGEVAGAAAAVLLGVGDAHQAEFAELLHDLVREALGAVELLRDRLYLALRRNPDQALDVALLVGQIEVHKRGRILPTWATLEAGRAVAERRIDLNELRERVRRRGLLRAFAEGPPPPPSPPPPEPPPLEWRVEPDPQPRARRASPTSATRSSSWSTPRSAERLRGCRMSCAAVITAAGRPAGARGGRPGARGRAAADDACAGRRATPSAASARRSRPRCGGWSAPEPGVMVLAHEHDRSVAAVDWTATGEWIGAKLTSRPRTSSTTGRRARSGRRAGGSRCTT